MTKTHRLINPKATLNCAIFEINGDSALVSASLGYVKMRYRDEMPIADARTVYAELKEEGWVTPSSSDQRSSWTHNDVYGVYR